MKTLFISTNAFSVFGGIQSFSARCCRALQEIELAAPNNTVNFGFSQERLSDIPLRFRAQSICLREVTISSIVQSALIFLRSDVLILAHVNLFPLALLHWAVRPKKRRLLVLHGVEVWGDARGRELRPLERLVVRNCFDRYLSVSSFTARIASERYTLDHDRISIFPNAVDVPSAEDAIVRGDSPNDGLYFLCISRLGSHDADKNVASLLEAFAILCQTNTDTKLLIVGDGPLRSSLEGIAAQLGVASKVDFLGRVDEKRLLRLLRNCAAFVLPSTKEGFGIVYLEAWVCRVPVIGGNEGGAAEIISDGVDGFVCDPRCPSELAHKMQILLSDMPLNTRLGINGFRKVVKLYSHDAFRDRLLSHIETSG